MATPLAVAVGDTEPHTAVDEHGTRLPFTVSNRLHVTPLFVASLVTVAVNWAEVPTFTVAEPGATDTAIPGTLTVAEPDALLLVTEVAVTTTFKSPAVGARLRAGSRVGRRRPARCRGRRNRAARCRGAGHTPCHSLAGRVVANCSRKLRRRARLHRGRGLRQRDADQSLLGARPRDTLPLDVSFPFL